MRSVIGQYASILPEDLRDTEVFMSQDTKDDLVRRLPEMDPVVQTGDIRTMFGLQVRIDENLPAGVVELRTENSFDRAIRRARSEVPPIYFPPAPPPTLRVLLAHWWKKFRRG